MVFDNNGFNFILQDEDLGWIKKKMKRTDGSGRELVMQIYGIDGDEGVFRCNWGR